MRIALAAALTALLLMATAASADLHRGHGASGDSAWPSATIRTATDRTARIQSASVSIPAASGPQARLRFTDTIKGARTTCRADVRVTLERVS